MTTEKQGCKGPSAEKGPCGRKTVAHGLCTGHVNQMRRGRLLMPLLGPRGKRAGVTLDGRLTMGLQERTRVTLHWVGIAMGASEHRAAGTGAREVLEAWERGDLVVKSKRKTPHLVRNGV